MSNVTSSSESVSTYNLSNLPTAEVVKGWSRDNVKEFLQKNRAELELEENDISVIYNQRVTGKAFLRLNREELTHEFDPFKLPYGPASAIAELKPPVDAKKHQFTESNKAKIG
ncbi:16618_t:CDS:2 [Entrophospora sp. SA101]|nr:16618_t:CDS:2 [Entrophospora sp. SA101]